jgi:O-antigen biosynthesis protein
MGLHLLDRDMDNLFLFLRLNQDPGSTVWCIYDEAYQIPDFKKYGFSTKEVKLYKSDQGLLQNPKLDSLINFEDSMDEIIEFCLFFFDTQLLVPEFKISLLNKFLGISKNVLIYDCGSYFSLEAEKNNFFHNIGFIEKFSNVIDDLPFRWYQKLEADNLSGLEDYSLIRTLNNTARQQRNLLSEYQQEIARVEMQAESLEIEKIVLDNTIHALENTIHALENDIAVINRLFLEEISDWQSFELTPTAKLVKKTVYLKNRILPTGGRLNRYLYYPYKFFQVIKEEGIHTAYLLISQKGKRFKYRLKHKFSKRDTEGLVCSIEEVARGHSKPGLNKKKVDIIICVHNALDDVQRCLESVLENTSQPYQIILIDDGSQKATRDYLKDFSTKNSNTQLLRSEEASGYTYAANRGLRISSSDYVVLLNSDTIVGPGWIDQMVACAETEENIGIVGPISNTASWQSVPKVERNGDWAENPLPHGYSVEKMAHLISEHSERMYPEMPLLNGFCLLMKKQLLKEIGLFDEENFGHGYGEEDDFVLRARQAGWKTALAEDTYIFHAQSKSYSSEKRKKLSKISGKNLLAKHGPEIIKESVKFCLDNPVLEGIRARVAFTPERHDFIEQGRKYSGKRVLFLLPSDGPGGGANVIIYEGLAMQKMGVDVELFNLSPYRINFENAYPDLNIPVVYGNISDLPRICGSYDAVIATHNETVYWLEKIKKAAVYLSAGYYIQGFEPLMYHPTNPRYKRALASYSLIPNLISFTKTQWTRDTVYQHTATCPEVVGISLDLDLFRPRPNSQKIVENRPLRVAAMVRPESPYREPEKTMQLLKKAFQHYGKQIEPVIFGTTFENPEFKNLTHDFYWQLYGIIPSKKVASLLNTADIFVDYSSHQAMGLTALEAMATGCAVIVPSAGGAVEFCKHEHNALVADASSFEDVWQSVRKLIDDDKLRKSLQSHAIYDVCQYYPEKAAYNILMCLFGS